MEHVILLLNPQYLCSLQVLQPKMYVKEQKLTRGIDEDNWIKFTVQKNASVWLQHLQDKSLESRRTPTG